jgi:hypothetical protein
MPFVVEKADGDVSMQKAEKLIDIEGKRTGGIHQFERMPDGTLRAPYIKGMHPDKELIEKDR